MHVSHHVHRGTVGDVQDEQGDLSLPAAPSCRTEMKMKEVFVESLSKGYALTPGKNFRDVWSVVSVVFRRDLSEGYFSVEFD